MVSHLVLYVTNNCDARHMNPYLVFNACSTHSVLEHKRRAIRHRFIHFQVIPCLPTCYGAQLGIKRSSPTDKRFCKYVETARVNRIICIATICLTEY